MGKVMFVVNDKGKREGVIISLSEYEEYQRLREEIESLKETFYLLRSNRNKQRLLEALQDVEKGLVEEHGLIED